MVARNGKWLGEPAAVMFAANGSALLQLSNPEYDAEKRRLTFEVRTFRLAAPWLPQSACCCGHCRCAACHELQAARLEVCS